MRNNLLKAQMPKSKPPKPKGSATHKYYLDESQSPKSNINVRADINMLPLDHQRQKSKANVQL